MKHRIIVPLVIALLALPGCSTLEAVSAASTGTISSVAPDAVNAAKKALTAAHDLHRVTANFLTVAAQANLCHATCAGTAKTLLDQSEAYLVAADRLVTLGDAPGIQAKITAATALISQVQSLIGKN